MWGRTCLLGYCLRILNHKDPRFIEPLFLNTSIVGGATEFKIMTFLNQNVEFQHICVNRLLRDMATAIFNLSPSQIVCKYHPF